MGKQSLHAATAVGLLNGISSQGAMKIISAKPITLRGGGKKNELADLEFLTTRQQHSHSPRIICQYSLVNKCENMCHFLNNVSTASAAAAHDMYEVN